MDFRLKQRESEILALRCRAQLLIPELAAALSVPPESLRNFRYNSDGISNCTFYFDSRDGEYVLRFPRDPERIDTPGLQYEKKLYEQFAAKGLRCTDCVKYFCAETGVKVTKRIRAFRYPELELRQDLERAIRLVRELHMCGIQTEKTFDPARELHWREEEARLPIEHYIEDYPSVRDGLLTACEREKRTLAPENYVFCHGDLIRYNFLFSDAGDHLIDYEYSGMNHGFSDLATMAVYASYDRIQMEEMLEIYLENKPDPAQRNILHLYVRITALFGILWYLDRGRPDRNEEDQIRYLLRYLKNQY